MCGRWLKKHNIRKPTAHTESFYRPSHFDTLDAAHQVLVDLYLFQALLDVPGETASVLEEQDGVLVLWRHIKRDVSRFKSLLSHFASWFVVV